MDKLIGQIVFGCDQDLSGPLQQYAPVWKKGSASSEIERMMTPRGTRVGLVSIKVPRLEE